MKKITIYVKNKELDAMEDIIVTKLSAKRRKELTPLALALWGRLVKAYDKVELD